MNMFRQCCIRFVLTVLAICLTTPVAYSQGKMQQPTKLPTLPATEPPRLTDNPDKVFGDSRWTFGNFKDQMAMMMIGDLANCDEAHPFIKITTDGSDFWYHLWVVQRHPVPAGQVASICYCAGDIRITLNRARVRTKLERKVVLWTDVYYLSLIRQNRVVQIDHRLDDKEMSTVSELFTLAQKMFDDQRQKVPVDSAQVINPTPPTLVKFEEKLKSWGNNNTKWAEATPR